MDGVWRETETSSSTNRTFARNDLRLYRSGDNWVMQGPTHLLGRGSVPESEGTTLVVEWELWCSGSASTAWLAMTRFSEDAVFKSKTASSDSFQCFGMSDVHKFLVQMLQITSSLMKARRSMTCQPASVVRDFPSAESIAICTSAADSFCSSTVAPQNGRSTPFLAM